VPDAWFCTNSSCMRPRPRGFRGPCRFAFCSLLLQDSTRAAQLPNDDGRWRRPTESAAPQSPRWGGGRPWKCLNKGVIADGADCRSTLGCGGGRLNLTLEIPDDLVRELSTSGGDLSRRAREAFGLEEFRSGHITKAGLRRLLGFASRDELDGFR